MKSEQSNFLAGDCYFYWGSYSDGESRIFASGNVSVLADLAYPLGIDEDCEYGWEEAPVVSSAWYNSFHADCDRWAGFFRKKHNF